MQRGQPPRKSAKLFARLRRIVPFFVMCLALSGLAMFALNAEMGSFNANLSPDDRDFLKKAAMTGLAEVALSKVAMERGENVEVRILGQRIVADREAVNADLVILARKKGVELPTALDERYRGRVEAIAELSGPDFDKVYLACMAKMQEREASEFSGACFATTDEQMKFVLGRALPVLKNSMESLGKIQDVPQARQVASGSNR